MSLRFSMLQHVTEFYFKDVITIYFRPQSSPTRPLVGIGVSYLGYCEWCCGGHSHTNMSSGCRPRHDLSLDCVVIQPHLAIFCQWSATGCTGLSGKNSMITSENFHTTQNTLCLWGNSTQAYKEVSRKSSNYKGFGGNDFSIWAINTLYRMQGCESRNSWCSPALNFWGR